MVFTGLEVLLRDHIDELRGKAVGIVGNHAAVTRDLIHASDALKEAGVRIAALYGPEHGARGDIADGELIGDSVDERLGVPVYSLYGKTRKPTPESLRGIDVMLVDIQDVGARFYTFIYTTAYVMQGCGEAGVPVWVLDRPNPITGTNPEGPILEPEFASFVGMYPIPSRHALTMGELARLFRARCGIECDLSVIPMQGWQRGMWYDQTGLPWVMPSPNMPTLDTTVLYTGTCLIEGTNVSEGRGTVKPFEQFGAPWVRPLELRNRLSAYELPGVMFRESYFTPTASKFNGERCGGVQLYVTDREAFRPVVTGVAVICALRELYPEQFAFRQPSPDHGRRFFDLLAGTASVREAIEAADCPQAIASRWTGGINNYESAIAEILLY